MHFLRTFIIILFLLPLCNCLCAQSFFIRGTVVDGDTGQPLANASVFINNSTSGTVTNAGGEFQLGPFAPGEYEVVASFVGYHNILYVANLHTASLKIKFEMGRKEQQMRELLILPSETRMRYLEIFKRTLLGQTNAAARAKIKNLKDVQFTAGKSSNEVIAYCDTTLVVDNPELGYVVNFDLVDFYFNRSTGESRFYGYTRFIDKDTDGETKRRWTRRRRQAYEGSSMHFFRSLVNRNLKQDGFSMQNVYRKEMKREPGATITIQSSGITSMDMAVPVTEDSILHLYSDSGYRIYQLKIADWLRVLYSKNTALKNEMTKNRIIAGQLRDITVSGVRPVKPPVPILVDYRGRLLTAMSFYYDGMWMYERLANMLPEDYVPD
ncbi:MAG: carboxypeptidase-like regulatory domain-containing protein [Lacibacter sp.]